MPDLVIRCKDLLHLESLHVPPQERRHHGHICFGHFAPSGRERSSGEGVFPDEAGDGLAAADRSEADVDEFCRVEVPVVVPG